MLLSAWLFVGVLALLATGIATSTADDAKAILAGITGALAWGYWAYGALDLRVVKGSTTYQFSQPELTILGVAVGLVPLFVALTGPFEVVKRVREPGDQEV
jgi:hypothetical protein